MPCPGPPASLVVGEPEATSAELLAEDAVLCLEVLDDVLLATVDPTGDEQDEEL